MPSGSMVKEESEAPRPSQNGLADKSAVYEGASGFLTKAQQEILDAAVKDKQRLGETSLSKRHSLDRSGSSGLAKSASLELKSSHKAGDRHSRSRGDRSQGKPKKRGAGGKYNWGSSLDGEAAAAAQDARDPNYDSAEELCHPVRLHSAQSVQTGIYKDAAVTIIKEFFLTGDAQEASLSLQDLGQPELGRYFVKKLLVASLDGNEHTRELASSLLSALSATARLVLANALPTEEIEEGFELVVQTVDDTSLDVPAAPEQIAQFIARAVIDDVLPADFCRAGGRQDTVCARAEALLSAPHAVERMRRCWGSEPAVTFLKVRSSIQALLKEFVASSDEQEAAACLTRIGLPLVHHELVKQALCMALTDPAERPALLRLLARFSDAGVVSEDQLVKGFNRVGDNIQDLALDVPGAEPAFKAICDAAARDGWLPIAELHAGGEPGTPSAAALDQSLRAFKATAKDCLKEYFSSGDCSELGRCLLEMNQPGFHSLVIKQAVQLSLDAKDREREMTAQLVRSLCPSVLTRDQVSLGVTRLLACAEDLTLDSPDAPHQLALLLGRLVVDEVLPPAFLTAVLPSLKDQSMGVSIVSTAGKLLSARHAAERLQICWHCGNRSVHDLKSGIKDLVSEYIVTGDAAEAARCWHDLGVGFFGHQLVVTVLLSAFEAPAKADLLLLLLHRLAASGEVSQTQIQKGFERIEAQLADLRLDYPSSPKQFASCKEAALQRGWIETSVQS